jgi:hypothetical protein
MVNQFCFILQTRSCAYSIISRDIIIRSLACTVKGLSTTNITISNIVYFYGKISNYKLQGGPAWGLGEVLTTSLRKKRMLRITHVQMLPLETKQSGDKLLPHSDLRGGGGF